MGSVGIELERITVEGINTSQRALGVKQMVLGGKKMGASVRIPILHDVSFSVKEGDRLALVGYNGSGKSSVLKVIAGIYPPKSGTLRVSGQVAPLIEMSLGFDMELTGRENIKLGLVYSGRLKDYTPQLEEEIITFTELGEHIDRPFKGYSSGMQARLSFAVSAFQQPEILLLDEVFAAGDISFIEKSHQVMAKKFESVPIIILVTHTPDLVRKFCNRCVWMHKGTVREEGDVETVLRGYEKNI